MLHELQTGAADSWIESVYNTHMCLVFIYIFVSNDTVCAFCMLEKS